MSTGEYGMHMDTTEPTVTVSQEMQARASLVIPGKTQLLSKRPEMFAPGVWPGYYHKAKGSTVWDLDGNEYLDFSIGGIGANVLGYADDDVDRAVIGAIQNGTSSSLNCAEEVHLAEYLKRRFPWLEMYRYTRSGGEAMSVAVRIARAKTSKDIILFCGYHGWHDWYLATNLQNKNNLDSHLLEGLSPKGVPNALKDTAIPFFYNDIDTLSGLTKKYSGKIAAVVMEPRHDLHPVSGFLEQVRSLCDENSIVLVFDEITSAFRETPGPLHVSYDVKPDIAVFSKAVSNGYPMGIIGGKATVMQAGQDTFISSTSWTERIGPVAALATIEKFTEKKVHETICRTGDMVRAGWQIASNLAEIDIEIAGLKPLLNFKFKHEDNLILRTLFVQKMLDYGFLASYRFYAMYSHTPEMVGRYLKAVEEVFSEISFLVKKGSHRSALRGPIAHSGFQRLN